MTRDCDVLIVGADANGLSAACRLAQAGRKVLVIDGGSVVGGTGAGAEFSAGYRHQGIEHDQGRWRAAVLGDLLPELANAPLSSRQPFVPQRSEDGTGLDLYPEDLAAEWKLAGISDSPDRWHEFNAFTKSLEPWIAALVDNPPPSLLEPGLRDLLALGKTGLRLRRLGRKTMSEVLRIFPMCSSDWLAEWFDDPLLLAGLAAPALYESGLGPRAPATNTNLLLSLCTSQTPLAGGTAALVDLLFAQAKQNGVEFQLGDRPRRLVLEAGRAVAVETSRGASYRAAQIAAACDPRHLFLELIGPRHLDRKFGRHLRAFRSRGTTAKIHLALDGLPALACRSDFAPAWLRIGPTLDHLERASDAWKYGQVAANPALDVRIPTLDDPALAPAGHHVLSALIYTVGAPRTAEAQAVQGEAVLEATLDTLSLYLPDIRQRVVASEVLTPGDLEQRFALTGGHLLHGDHGLDQLLIRPTPECAGYRTPIEGLFLCGNGSHPGGTLPGSAGALASEVIRRAG